MDLKLRQINVKTTFSNRELSEEVYMEQLVVSMAKSTRCASEII